MMKEVSNGGGEEATQDWMTTYGDLVTLLLVFFVLLFSMSTLEITKFEAFVESTVTESTGGTQGTATGKEAAIAKARESIAQLIKKNKQGNNVNAKITSRGVEITLDENIMFAPGSATLKTSSRTRTFLKNIGKLLKSWPYKVMVEGHTDNVPIKTSKFPSNWELSSARASAVVNFFISKRGSRMEARRFIAAGLADTNPVKPNSTAEFRAKNRRVIIVVLKDNFFF